jgi:hypothetical protein
LGLEELVGWVMQEKVLILKYVIRDTVPSDKKKLTCMFNTQTCLPPVQKTY